MILAHPSSRSNDLLGSAVLSAWFAYLVIGTTWGFSWIDSWHNEQRATQAVLLAVSAVASLFIPEVRRMLIFSRFPYLVWGALLVLVSALAAANVFAAVSEVSLHLLLLLVTLITAVTVARDPPRYNFWLQRMCALLALIHVTGIGARYVATLLLARPPDIEVLLLGYANPRFPSALYALLMPFLATLVVDVRERTGLRRVAFVLLTLLWTVNLALGTRAIWFAFAVALPLLALLAGWRPLRTATIVMATSSALGALCFYLLFFALPDALGTGSALVTRADQITSLSDRERIWSQAWHLIVAHPLLGTGPMSFAALGDSFAAHPHNWLLQLGAEYGMPVLLIVSVLLWRIGVAARTTLQSDMDNARFLLGPLAATAVGLCYGLVDGNLVMPVSQSAFAIVLGALLGSIRGVRREPAASRDAPGGVTALVSLASAACLLAFVAITLPQQPANERAWRKTSAYPYLAPRFWQQGLLR